MTSCKITIFSKRYIFIQGRFFHRHVTFRGSIFRLRQLRSTCRLKKKHHPAMTKTKPLVATSLADQSWVDEIPSEHLLSPLSSRFCGWKPMAKHMKPRGYKPCYPDPLVTFVINLLDRKPMSPRCVISKHIIYIYIIFNAKYVKFNLECDL